MRKNTYVFIKKTKTNYTLSFFKSWIVYTSRAANNALHVLITDCI